MKIRAQYEGHDSVLSRLQTHPKAREAEQRLRREGLTDGGWNELIASVARIPFQHSISYFETAHERTARRAQLLRKMRNLARDIQNDRDAQWITIWYDGGRMNVDHVFDSRQPPIHVLLRDAATVLDDLDEGQNVPQQMTTRKGNDLRSYAARAVHALIEQLLPPRRGRRAKNQETALLTTALLGDTSPTDLTANDVAQIRRKERRRYTRDG